MTAETPSDPPAGAPSSSAASLSHAGIDSVVAQLHAAGWDGTVHTFANGVKTAKAAADGLGCEVGAIANSLIFDADGRPALILTSGAHRVDPVLVSETIGVSALNRATPDFVRTHTGQTIGGVAPLGHPAPLPTYIDRALVEFPVIWAAAGHSHAVFNTTYDELRALTKAVEIDVT